MNFKAIIKKHLPKHGFSFPGCVGRKLLSRYISSGDRFTALSQCKHMALGAFRYSVESLLIIILHTNVIVAKAIEQSEAEVFKAFVANPPVIVDFVIDDPCIDRADGQCPMRFKRFEWQDNGTLIRCGKTFDSVEKTSDKPVENIFGYYSSNYWTVDKHSNSEVALKEFFDDGQPVVTGVGIKERVVGMQAVLARFLSFGLMAMKPKSLVWDGDSFKSECLQPDGKMMISTGYVESVNGRVVKALGGMGLLGQRFRKFKVVYNYSAAIDHPRGIPTSYQLYGISEDEKVAKLSWNITILKLKISETPQGEDAFHPSRQLGRLKVLHVRENQDGVKYLSEKNKWQPLASGGTKIEQEAKSRMLVLFSMFAISVVSILVLLNYVYRSKPKNK